MTEFSVIMENLHKSISALEASVPKANNKNQQKLAALSAVIGAVSAVAEFLKTLVNNPLKEILLYLLKPVMTRNVSSKVMKNSVVR